MLVVLKETKAESLADTLVERLERQILAGELKPGARFPTEKTITEDFGVSRTVVREAFARLAARGLLTSRRGSGAYVAETAQYRAFQITPDELSEIDDVLKLLEMRIALEGEMATLAADRRTDDDLAAMRAALAAMSESEDMDASVAEVKRLADKGCHAVSMNDNPSARGLPSIHKDYWEPLWKAVNEAGTTICLHI